VSKGFKMTDSRAREPTNCIARRVEKISIKNA
jgi:hypothetical protein